MMRLIRNAVLAVVGTIVLAYLLLICVVVMRLNPS